MSCCTDVTLFAMAQDVVESIALGRSACDAGSQAWRHAARTVSLNRSMNPGRKTLPASMSQTFCKPQLLHQAILQRAVRSLDSALGLAGVRADDLDVQLCQRTAELRHA